MSRSRDIILFCDGTNNTLTGGANDTNVLKLFQHLRAGGHASQILYYDPGVGSPDGLPAVGGDVIARKWERVSALASGHGVYENIREGYAFLVRHWQPGDRIWIFGFSRGAFTARAISGMVHLFGLIAPEHASILDTLMRVYFSKVDRQGVGLRVKHFWRKALGLTPDPPDLVTRDGIARQIRNGFTGPGGENAAVHFVGVWDTVESVGLPYLGSVTITSSSTIENKRILHARHALSLDEHRKTFSPRLYEQADVGYFPVARKEDGTEGSLRQLWFRGVHSDVGGGYATWECGLSNVALTWMVNEAMVCGLRCHPLLETAPHKQHDPTYTVPWWALGGLWVRDIPRLSRGIAQVAHPSVTDAGAAPASIWQESQSKLTVVIALVCAALAVLGQALLLGGLPRVAELALAQLRYLLFWSQSSMAPLSAQMPGAKVGWALAVDMLLIGSYSYVLARLFARAFHQMAGPGHVRQRAPSWQALGMAPVICVSADVVENLLTFWVRNWTAPLWSIQILVLFAIGLASASKFVAGALSIMFVFAALWA